jgi:penicillin-binding protein 2
MRQVNDSSWIYWILRVGLVCSLTILLANMVKLSVIRNKYYQEMARNNRILEKPIPAGRGQIVDRKGRVIAKSIYQYFKVDGDKKVYEGVGDFQGYKFEGNDLAYELKRQYPYGESTSFISGYVGKVGEDDIKNNKCNEKLDNGEVVGRSGIEQSMDCDLRGAEGIRMVEVDAKGKYIRELGRQEPVIGQTVNLSIDAYWQEKIYKLLDGKKAVVIISDPKTGKIINFVSSPAFDPNAFSYDQDNQTISSYLDDKDNMPLLNRISSARYEPGSVFKIVTSTAGLESGVINRESTYEDTGTMKVGEYSYSNWQWTKSGIANGMVNVVTALQKSNDIFFYKLGGDLGLDRIYEWSKKYGYGAKTGLELPGELEGVNPNEKWKESAKGEKWYLGDTYHLSIGQGFLSVTPLQVNQMTNIIANHGVKCKMSLLKDSKPQCQNIGLKRDTWETVIEGMRAACKTGGTAWPLFNFKTQIACKTGTAEVGDGSKDTHAWLTAFAPADDPEISITVLVERGGEGSDVAAPIVGDILKEWFNEPNTIVPRYTTNKENSE